MERQQVSEPLAKCKQTTGVGLEAGVTTPGGSEETKTSAEKTADFLLSRNAVTQQNVLTKEILKATHEMMNHEVKRQDRSATNC